MTFVPPPGGGSIPFISLASTGGPASFVAVPSAGCPAPPIDVPSTETPVPMFRVLLPGELDRQIHQDVVFVIRRQTSILGLLRSLKGISVQPSFPNNPVNSSTHNEPIGQQEGGTGYALPEGVVGIGPAGDFHRTDNLDPSSSAATTGGTEDLNGAHSGYYRPNCYEYGVATVPQRFIANPGPLSATFHDPSSMGMTDSNTFVGSGSLFSLS